MTTPHTNDPATASPIPATPDAAAPTEATAESAGGKRDYLPAERQNMILNLLTRQSVATVAELATMLNTTEITVRRDLTALSNAGLIKRVRGGAMSVSDTAENGPSPIPAIANTSFSERTPAGAIAVKPTTRTVELGLDQPAIGVMLPEPSFFWPGVIECMRSYASRLGLRIVTRETAYDIDAHEDEILDDLVSDPTVCGVIAAPSSHPVYGRKAWNWIERSDTPVVVIERDLPMLGGCFVDSVRTNHPYGVRKAADHFIRHGHTLIGAAFNDSPTSSMIQEGWRDVIESTDDIQCPFVFDGIMPYDTKGVNGIVDKILLSGVTAMLVHSDYLAIAIAQAMERRGRRVPEDLSMISIDGFATPSSRPLTVLRSSDKDLAEVAIGMLLYRIQNPEAATRHTLVDPNLIDRGSVVDVQ